MYECFTANLNIKIHGLAVVDGASIDVMLMEVVYVANQAMC